MEGTKGLVTPRGLLQRINRKLLPQDCILKKSRRGVMLQNFGAYYVLNWRSNLVTTPHVDPTALARELGVLAGWEVVAEEYEAAMRTFPVR